METISLTTSIKPVGATTAQSGNSDRQLFQASQGQIIKALVLEALGGDRFTLEIGSEHISARSKAPLDVGQQLRLEVMKTAPQIELKLVSDSDNINTYLGKSVSLLGRNIDLAALVNTIRQQPASVTSQLQPSSQTTLGNFVSSQQQAIGNALSYQSTGQAITGNLPAITQNASENAFALQQFAIDKILSTQQGTTTNPLAPPQASIGNIPILQQFTIEKVLFAPRTGVENLLPPVQSNLAGKEGGEFLKQIIDNVGLNLENLLAKGDKERGAQTIKAALLDVLQTFSRSDNISETTNKLLATIEMFQLAQLQLSTQSIFILPLPLPFIEQGYLLIENFPQEKKESSSEYEESRFSLHLNLTDFGNLRIDFLKNKEGLYLRFHTDSQEKSQFLQNFGSELEKSITGVPFVKISYSNDAQDPVGELLRLLVPKDGAMFDTQA